MQQEYKYGMFHYKRIFFIIPFFCLLSQIALGQVDSRNSRFTVVIDAGHGGKDPGAIGSTSREKNIALAVAKKLGALIEANHSDVKVIYTRKTDVFVELNKRAQIANNARADLFISLHCNALSRKQVSPQGVETFVLGLHRSKDNLEVAKNENSVILYEDDYSTKYQGFNPSEPESYIIFEFMTNKFLDQSVQLASLVQHNLVKNSKRVNRNVRQAGFLVLREVAMPSILVEMGYISNKTDENYMKSERGQTSIASSIYNAFTEYKAEYDKKSGKVISESRPPIIAPQEEFVEEVSESDLSATNSNNTVTNATEYRIQFFTAPRKYSNGSSVFKGLSPVDFYKEGSTYKYTYGSTTDKNESFQLLKKAKRLFKDAFIVEFQNGKRVR